MQPRGALGGQAPAGPGVGQLASSPGPKGAGRLEQDHPPQPLQQDTPGWKLAWPGLLSHLALAAGVGMTLSLAEFSASQSRWTGHKPHFRGAKKLH